LRSITLKKANFEGANFESAYFKETNLKDADLQGALNLSDDQLSIAKTLYGAKLDKEQEIRLREKYTALFIKPDDDN